MKRIDTAALRKALPPDIRNAKAFVVWKFEEGRKIPHYADGSRRRGANGSTEDRVRLSTFEDVVTVHQHGRWDGIGIALLPELNLTALDFDHCRTNDGMLTGPAEEFISTTYSEVSPSGTGIRCLFRGSLPDSRSKSVEVFSQRGYVTLTGHSLNGSTICEATNAIRDRIKELTTRTTIHVDFTPTMIAAGERDSSLTSMAGTMRRRGLSSGAIEAALAVENRNRCEEPLPDKQVRKIARSVAKYPVGGADEKATALAFRKESQAIGEGPAVSVPYPELYTIQDMINKAIFISDGSQVTTRNDPRAALSFPDFVNLTSASEAGSGPQGGRPTSVARMWLKSAMRMTVHARTFHAGHGLFCQSPNDVLAVNTWREPPRIKPPPDWKERAKFFLDHINYLVPKPEERGLFLDWLAHIEQYPGVLPHIHFLMFTRQQGIGRNWLASVLARVWQGVTALDVDLPQLLDGGFNGRLSRKILAVVNEIHGGSGSYRHADRLKGLLTDERRRINPKFGREYDEFNSARWLMFSNHENALPLDRFDRRIFAIQNPDRPRSTVYYSKLYRIAADVRFIASVREILRTRDIRKFNPGMHAPLTETKQRVIEAGMSEPDRLMAEIVREYPGDCITSDRLCRMLWGIRTTPKEMGALPYIAARSGARRFSRRVRVGPKRGRCHVWILRDHERWISANTRDVIAEIIRGEKEDTDGSN